MHEEWIELQAKSSGRKYSAGTQSMMTGSWVYTAEFITRDVLQQFSTSLSEVIEFGPVELCSAAVGFGGRVI